MKRLLVVFALALAVGALVFPSSASATHDVLGFESAVEAMLAVDPTLDPPPNDGRHDFVVAGFIDANGRNWGVSAYSGPAGEDPFGHASATFPTAPSEFKQGRWRVVCVTVRGNVAVVGAVPTRASAIQLNAVLRFRDGGPGGGTALTSDGFFFDTPGAPPQAHCLDSTELVKAEFATPISNGNILIHDTQP